MRHRMKIRDVLREKWQEASCRWPKSLDNPLSIICTRLELLRLSIEDLDRDRSQVIELNDEAIIRLQEDVAELRQEVAILMGKKDSGEARID